MFEREPIPGERKDWDWEVGRSLFDEDNLEEQQQEEEIEDYWDAIRFSPLAPMPLTPQRLRAGDLNSILEPDFLERKRLALSPMQAFGATFKDATVIGGIHELNKESWTMVANENDLRPPDDAEVLRAMEMQPERAIQQAFGWTDDWKEVKRHAFEQREAYAKILPKFNFNATPGAIDWLTALKEYEVPCVVTSGVSREQLHTMLEKAGLEGLFQGVVAAEDGCDTAQQAYLLACVKMKRQPIKCVVFEDDADGVAAAHDASSKVIAVVGRKPGFQFGHADLRIGSLDELTLSAFKEVGSRDPDPMWAMETLRP